MLAIGFIQFSVVRHPLLPLPGNGAPAAHRGEYRSARFSIARRCQPPKEIKNASVQAEQMEIVAAWRTLLTAHRPEPDHR
jgi:hypothetical protein